VIVAQRPPRPTPDKVSRVRAGSQAGCDEVFAHPALWSIARAQQRAAPAPQPLRFLPFYSRAVRNRSKPLTCCRHLRRHRREDLARRIETDRNRYRSAGFDSRRLHPLFLIQSRHFRGTVRHLGLPVPRGCHGLAVERLHGFSRNVRRQMGIAHGHVHRCGAVLPVGRPATAATSWRGRAAPERP